MKRIFFKIILFTLLSFYFSACDLNNEPIQKKNYSVLGNLIANSTYQKIYIYKTLNTDEPIEDFIRDNTSEDWVCNNAFIKIIGSNLVFNNFSIVTDTVEKGRIVIKKYYRNNSYFPIIPGKQYNLRIETVNDTIVGSTIIPGNFQIQNPLDNQTFNYNLNVDSNVVIPIKWTKSIDAAGYIVNLFYVNIPDSVFETVFSIILSNKDTTFSIIRNYWRVMFAKGRFKIEVLAFDKNLYDHIVRNLPTAGIEGAYGYFGSSVLKSKMINIK